MAARARVGIIYRDNENWIGGTYYIQNLILALKTVPEEQKPQLTIFCATEKEYSQINNLGYPYLEWKQLVILHPRLALHKRIINKLSYVLKGFDVFHQPLSFDTGGCDVVFPAFVGMTNKKIKRIVVYTEINQHLVVFFNTI